MTTVLGLVLTVALAIVPVSELDADPETWNGEDVTVSGEIIGDYSTRDDVVWFQLNDDPYASIPLAERSEPVGTNTGIGVRIPRSEWSEEWGGPGGYGRRGPIVEVTGTFLHNSPDDQGETFIAGSEVRLIERARPIETRPASPLAAATGVALGAIGLVLYRLGRRPRYRRDR